MRLMVAAMALAGLLGSAFSASATTLFSEDFESGLGQWSPNVNGQIAVDPTDASNHALNFSNVYVNGDIFSSTAISLTAGQIYKISFDYYGAGLRTETSGGFAGLADGTLAHRGWYGASYDYPGTQLPSFIIFSDNTGWNSYTYTFVAPIQIQGSDVSTLRLMFEDFNGAGSVAGNAYFDNIVVESVASPHVTPVPLPATLPLFASSLGAFGLVGCWRRKRRKAATAAV